MSEIEKKLKREMDAKVPDLKEKIMAEAFPESAVRQPRGKSAPFALRRAIYSVCIVVALAAIIITAALLTPPPGGTTVVVSINPRVEFVLDDDTIVSQKGLNEDGVTLLLNDNYVGMNINQAVDKLLGRAKSLGFLKDNRTVKLAVNYSNGKRAEKEYRELSALITDFLSANLRGASLALLTEDEMEDIIDSYDEKALNGFQERQLAEFREKLAQVIRTKMNGLDELKDLVTEQISACGVTDRKERIPETVIADINGALKDFLFEFPSEISLLSEKAKFEDLEELMEEIDDVKEDLADALEEIDEGHEDDLKDRIEDLFEIAWELMNPDDD